MWPRDTLLLCILPSTFVGSGASTAGHGRSGSKGVTPPRRHASAPRGDGQQGGAEQAGHPPRPPTPCPRVRVCPPRQLEAGGVRPRRASPPVRSGATARCGRVCHCPQRAGGPVDVGAPRSGVPRLYRRPVGPACNATRACVGVGGSREAWEEGGPYSRPAAATVAAPCWSPPLNCGRGELACCPTVAAGGVAAVLPRLGGQHDVTSRHGVPCGRVPTL